MSSYSREIWKDIRGYEGYYQVSNWARVKSLARTVVMSNSGSSSCERRDGKPRTYHVREKILKPAWDGHYFHVILSKDGKESCRLVHCLVAEVFYGPCPEGMEARHLNGKAMDCTPGNLCWGTSEENAGDRVKHGTNSTGKKGVSWKLKGKSQEVRTLFATGDYSLIDLAKMFRVGVPSIRYTVRSGIRKFN